MTHPRTIKHGTRPRQPTGRAAIPGRGSGLGLYFACLALLLGLSLAVTRGAAADDSSTSDAADARGDVTAYRFDDELVQGGTQRPDAEVLHVRKRGTRESLIRARAHFIPELLKSAADL